MRPVQAGWWW
ncbi:rCG58903 [Rattus norvegicus]|uniref:RCG58903 n=1 Tax=Rattus norvegicus TaxID=10116 RepID=A6KQ31_RAT|nr:rCG58903 [Rattus norvegicus]